MIEDSDLTNQSSTIISSSREAPLSNSTSLSSISKKSRISVVCAVCRCFLLVTNSASTLWNDTCPASSKVRGTPKSRLLHDSQISELSALPSFAFFFRVALLSSAAFLVFPGPLPHSRRGPSSLSSNVLPSSCPNISYCTTLSVAGSNTLRTPSRHSTTNCLLGFTTLKQLLAARMASR